LLPFFSPQDKFKKILLLFFFIFLSLFLLALSPERQSSIKHKIMLVLAPFQRTAFNIDSNLSALKKKELNIEELRKENQRLSEELSSLVIEKNLSKELERENKRLRELLAFERKLPFKLTPAQIIGRDSTNWNKVIFINKGSVSGLKNGFPVITPEGLVGQIIETTPHQSKVMTILDNNSRVAALVEQSRVQGVICGTNDSFCQLNYISLREQINEKDSVISSGQGGVFPKGLLIGKVSSVKKKETDLFQKIKVSPAVNLSRLEEIMVIIEEK